MYSGKIAVPSSGNGGLSDERSQHFGHCNTYTIVEVEKGKIAEVSTIATPAHEQAGCLVPVNLLAKQQVKTLIASGMGMRPLMGFQEAGIDVFFDTQYTGVGQAVENFLTGNMVKMTPDKACGGGHNC